MPLQVVALWRFYLEIEAKARNILLNKPTVGSV